MKRFELILKQTGLFRMKLKPSDIIPDGCVSGMHDRFHRLFHVSVPEGYLLIYDPSHIGCGVSVLLDEERREEAHLYLPFVATVDDIDLLFLCLVRMMKKWHERIFLFEQKEYRVREIDDLKKELRRRVFQNMADHPGMLGDKNVAAVRAVRWPLFIPTAKIHEFGIKQDGEGFAALLQKMQEKDYHWCSCHVYISEDQKGYIGVYTIPAGVDCIIPSAPHAPLDMYDPISGDAIACSKYFVKLMGGSSQELILQMEYGEFLKRIETGSLKQYDVYHLILEGFDEAKMRALAQR